MKRYIGITLALILGTWNMMADNNREPQPIEQDSIQSLFLNEVIVSSSTKETNDLKTLPASVSFITSRMMEGQNIVSIKNLSSIIPNFFIADYGSRLSSPVYIRGIGERSTGQSIGMYIDNMPLLDKSVFDFDFMDVRQIDVLRGPQGTLYGRNAMSGIVNVTTFSPLDIQRTSLGLTAGNYGLFRAKAATSQLLSNNVGISVNGYYDGNDGYFTNQYSNKRADKMKSGGGRIRLDWKINPNWTAQWMANYDYSDQGAFPYGEYNDGNIGEPNYNFPGSYIRETIGSNLNLQYRNQGIIFNSATAFLHFNDNMKMDIDYGPADMFTINQKQRQNAWTQEFTLKSDTKSNYQWSFGAFGFYNNLRTDVVTTMGPVAIENVLQKMFDDMRAENPRMPQMTVTDERIPIPGRFKTPSYGGAVFHQSTYNNLFTEGLSVTAGIRLDYERTKLDYDTSVEMNLDVSMPYPPFPIVSQAADTIMRGDLSSSFTEVLPKVALKYEFNPSNYIYATVANGYKTGGYNIQNFADIAQIALRAKYDSSIESQSVKSQTLYKPEYSRSYEVGYKGELIKNILYGELAAFYIDVKDIQITDFVESGHGRVVKNAGKAKSMGFDVALNAYFTPEFGMSANYGFTRATFKDYKVKAKDGQTIDYSDNFVPFAPQNTFAVGAVYRKSLRNAVIDRFHVQAHYNGAGRIYWSEANDVHQDFYGLLNLKAGVSKGIFDLNIWANNILDTDYTAFYFETESYKLAQKGCPFTFGADLRVTF